MFTNPLRRLYNWTETLSYKKGAIYYLATIAFVESSFFPIPPDVMLLPMAFFNNKKAFFYAFVTTLFSVLGGLFGYVIGVFIYNNIIPPNLIIGTVISKHNFDKVVTLFQNNVFFVVFTAAFTPIPFKVFTIASGYCKVALIPFTVASIMGRGGRFFTESLLFYFVGSTIKPYIEKNFEKLTILITLAIISFYILVVKFF